MGWGNCRVLPYLAWSTRVLWTCATDACRWSLNIKPPAAFFPVDRDLPSVEQNGNDVLVLGPGWSSSGMCNRAQVYAMVVSPHLHRRSRGQPGLTERPAPRLCGITPAPLSSPGRNVISPASNEGRLLSEGRVVAPASVPRLLARDRPFQRRFQNHLLQRTRQTPPPPNTQLQA